LAETNQLSSVACQVDKLYGAARTMMPDGNWTWLKRLKTRLYASIPASNKTGPIITSLPLLELGLQLMDECRPQPDKLLRSAEAVRYRDGLIIAFGAFTALRRKNLAAIQIGRHLVREGDAWIIIIPRAETKSGAPIEFEVPDVLKTYLAVYLDVVRPRLLRGLHCTHLWVSSSAQALTYSAFWPITTRHTECHLGVRISPHKFRDAGPTTWAIVRPDQIAVASDLLGHTHRPTTRHYNRARGIEASRVLAGVLAGIRKSTANS
jgi:integrase